MQNQIPVNMLFVYLWILYSAFNILYSVYGLNFYSNGLKISYTNFSDNVAYGRGWQHSLVEIDHEMFSTVILSLPLIQEGQLSVSGERMCAILVNRLED